MSIESESSGTERPKSYLQEMSEIHSAWIEELKKLPPNQRIKTTSTFRDMGELGNETLGPLEKKQEVTTASRFIEILLGEIANAQSVIALETDEDIRQEKELMRNKRWEDPDGSYICWEIVKE